MTGIIETAGAAIVAGWVLHHVIALGLKEALPRSWVLAGCYGIASIAAWIGGFGWGIWVALVEPTGAMLPVLCLATSLRLARVWDPSRPPALDLVLLALAMSVVLLGAGGFGPVNPYAWFYAGIEPALLAALVALWAVWRNQMAVLIAVIAGQVWWLADIGSSNLYDHLAHFALVPALLVAALLGVVRRALTPPTQ